MQSQNRETIGSDLEDAATDEFAADEFKFRLLFGEFCLLQKLFKGDTIKPDLFAASSNNSSNNSNHDLTNLALSELAHIVSARCESARTLGISTIDGRIVYTYKIFDRMFVDVSGDYENYLAGFRKKSLNSLKRKIKKAETTNSSKPTIQDFTDPSDVREFVSLAKPISAKSYQEAQLGTVFRTDEQWVSQLETLARNNQFRGYVLYIEDQPVAYNYCPIYGDGVLLYDLSGYLPDSSRHSPGTILQAHIIKQSFADRSIKFYDLCEGEGRHKEQFATGFNTCYNAYIFPKTSYYLGLVFAHRALDLLSTKIVALLESLGVKDRVKTFMRRLG